jgi:membrane fusion protein (multidrug efflux system)
MHLKRWILALLFCVVVVAVLGFVKFTQVKAAIAFGESFPEPSETVQVQVATASQWQASLQVSGQVLATRNLAVRNELAGVITEVAFASGAPVQKGDLLLQMDVSNEQAQLDGLNAQVQIAQLDVNRFSKLLESNASSRDQYDRAKAQLAVSQASVRALQTQIVKKTLIAPFDALAGLHELEVGAFLSANTLITQLISRNNELWIDFSVPQEYSDLATGQSITLSSVSLLSADYSAQIIGMSQAIAQESRNLRVRALWENVPQGIKPGAMLDVTLPVGEPLNIVRLPGVAIRYDAFGSYVFSLNRDQKGAWRAKRLPIDIEARLGPMAIVSAGLEVGTTVATIGSSKLREGILVNLADDNLGIASDE